MNRKISDEQRVQIAERYMAGEGTKSLAEAYGVTSVNILRILRLMGIERRPRGRSSLKPLQPDEVAAAVRSAFDFDGQQLRRYGDHDVVCIERTCLGCGAVAYLPASHVRCNYGKRFLGYCKTCILKHPSRAAKGKDHPRWNGGRTITEAGYIYVSAPDHPNATVGGYVLEHRLVMEKMLGRRLLGTESVHHINGVRHDNRPENLELWTRVQSAGIRLLEAPHCPTCTCYLQADT